MRRVRNRMSISRRTVPAGSINAFATGPSLLEPRRTAEKALTAVIQGEADRGRRPRKPTNDIKGISTRAVDDLVKAMGGTGVSKSQVSRLCEGKAG